MLTAHVGLHIK